MERDAALLIVDVQNDFCPNGALPVPEGDRVVEPLNRALEQFVLQELPVLASRDWHPPRTRHFKAYGGIWPVHCVQGSPGAAFHPGLHLPDGTLVVSKGADPARDGYSAFEGETDTGIPLAQLLASLGVRRLYVGGLATDYCVRSSVLDALRLGFGVMVLTDAIAGVDVSPGDSGRALEEMARAGALFCSVSSCAAGEARVRAA